MKGITLPISKSIANRILLLQAIHGDPLMRVSSDMPDDVIVLHDALQQLLAYSRKPKDERQKTPLTLYLKNCGTALRFLQVHIAQCYPGEPITLAGDPRLMERDGKPTSQTHSALLMHGMDVADDSPYVEMTRRVIQSYVARHQIVHEYDWSAAAFWYEYVSIHGGELLLEGLTSDSLQGDRVVADIYAKYFGVDTIFVPEGAQIRANGQGLMAKVAIDFDPIPDLYPAIALTCERLGIELQATGTERLRYKESDRLEAVRLHEVRSDHRMAMALMAAGFPVDQEEQACIAKSYPQFISQFSALHNELSPVNGQQSTVSHITPIKGVNDDHRGKKHALSKLIHAATSDYLWLHDDDVVLPAAATSPLPIVRLTSDMVILPLRMASENPHPSLLERLQIAEYAAIQEVTMRTAKRNKAVMCSGANMIVRREAWLACEQDLHPEIPSGDDMFLLEAAKRRGMHISVMDKPDYTAVVRPVPTWGAFFRQRMRWAGKAPHYTDPDILRCGALVTIANVLQVLCPLVVLVKFPIEYSLIRKREPQTSWLVALLLEIVYPFYLLVCLIGGLFRRQAW